MKAKNEDRRMLRRAVVGLVAIALLLLAATNVSTLKSTFGAATYSARLNDGGGVRVGDDVRVDGINVGEVTKLELDGTTVTLEFRASDVKMGNESRVLIRSENALGRKYVDLEPAGVGDVRSIPAERTDSGYSAPEVLGDIAATTGQLDTEKVARAFDSISNVLEQSPAEFGDALTGVRKLSETISSRDAALGQLLQRASSVSGLLAERNGEITDIFGQGSLLFQTLLVRRMEVTDLLSNVIQVTRQIRAFVTENKSVLPKSLTDLLAVADVLASYRSDLSEFLVQFSGYVRGLGDAVASGPFYQAFLVNLTTPESLLLGGINAKGGSQ